MPLWLQEMIKAYIPKIVAALKLTGFKAWIAEKALKYGGQALIDYYKFYSDKIKAAIGRKKAKTEFDVIKENPDSTIDQKGDAYEDYINNDPK